MAEARQEQPQLDVTRPNTARMYDYYLGGKDNYATDREAAEEILQIAPFARAFARQGRGFLNRAVRHLVREGIRQFIDVGTGLPTQDNVHQVAQALTPDARVVYVDNDPVVTAHGRALLAADNTAMIEQDLRSPANILADPRLRRLIRFDEPIGMLLVSVLHCVDDEDRPYESVAVFRDALPPGSYLTISHLTVVDELTKQTSEVYRRATTNMVHRTREEIRAFFGGLTLLEPGLVHLHQWRPDATTPDAPLEQARYVLCGVGRKDE